MNVKNRRKEREIAMWKIFQDDFHDQGEKSDVEEFLEDAPDEDMIARMEVNYEDLSDYPDVIEQAFLDNREAIDDMIASHLKKNWSLDKIPKAEKAIMRLALAELYFVPQPVPKEIAINEAVDLTKRYGEDDARRYVNGILNKVVEDRPQTNVFDPREQRKGRAEAKAAAADAKAPEKPEDTPDEA